MADLATVRRVLAGLTDAELAGWTEPVTEPGYPPPQSYAVRRCLQAILTEFCGPVRYLRERAASRTG